MLRLASLLTLVVAATLSTAALAEKKVALVIGNDRYPQLPADRQLQKAVNDARAVGDALERLGFTVIRGENLDRRTMVERLFAFTRQVEPGDTAFLFYAGHGVAIGGGNSLATRRRLEQARLETERYKRLAMEDALTGLANRRQLDERLEVLMRDARKSGTTVTVALADVDHFKGINDRFSHAVGDEVLRCVGEILRAHCRLGDLAGRYGGEEFMLVFRNLDMRAATDICERVRLAIESWDWKSIHPQLRVTLSMGLASSASLDTTQGVLDAADHWLYEAKHHGRNQIQPVVVTPA